MASLTTETAAPFERLLESTLRHLEHLKARGRRYIRVAPGTLEDLARPLVRSARSAYGASGGASSMETESSIALRPDTTRESPASDPAPGSGSAGAAVLSGEGQVPGAGSGAEAREGVGDEGRASQMAALRERALVCQHCPHLAGSRTQVVFGVGDIHASLMFVGEAPGADEDRLGEPFVGRAGELLTRIIRTMGLDRDRVYIANIVKCRPDTPGQRSGNRKPTSEEMATCIPYLHEQIELIGPKVLVALGATAVEGLLGQSTGITRMRGQWRTFRDIPLMPTYHPAYLLRNQSNAEKRKVWEDMLQVMERLGMEISEKQRGYFLAGQ